MELPTRAAGLGMDDIFGDPDIAAAKDRAEADAIRAKKQPVSPAPSLVVQPGVTGPQQPIAPVPVLLVDYGAEALAKLNAMMATRQSVGAASPQLAATSAQPLLDQQRQTEALIELEQRRNDIAQDEMTQLNLRRQAYATYFAESEAGYRKQQQRIQDSIAVEQLEQRQVLANLQARRDYFRTPQGREAAQGQAAVGKQVEQAKFDADWAQMEAERGKMGAAMGMLGREIADIGVILPGQFGHLFGKIGQFTRAFESIGRIAGALFGGEPAAGQPQQRERGAAPPMVYPAQRPVQAGVPQRPEAPAIAPEEIPYGEVVEPPVPAIGVDVVREENVTGGPSDVVSPAGNWGDLGQLAGAYKKATKPPTPATAPKPPVAAAAKAAPQAAEVAGAAEGAGAAAGGAEAAGGLAAAGGGMAAAAGPIGIAVAAAVAVVQGLNSAISGTIHGLGDFAAAIASPNMDPAVPIGAAGSAIEGFGSKVLLISPALGLFATALGSSLSALAQFMNALDQLAKRYEQYSPHIAMAQGMAEMRTTMGEVSRANRIGPAMSEYIGARTDLQEQFENIKIRLLQALLPIAVKVMGEVGKAVEFLEKIFDTVLEVLETLAELPGIPGTIKDGVKQLIANLRPGTDTELPWDINSWINNEIGFAANWPGD